MNAPLIGIDTDLTTDDKGVERCTLRSNYVKAIIEAGGVPLLLPTEPTLASTYVKACDGILLTGGDDPRTEPFGEPTHPRARPIEARRQAFIIALLAAIDEQPALPTLGICLGMQMMSLHAGGKLHQYLPDILTHPQIHQACNPHPVTINHPDSVLFQSLARKPAAAHSATLSECVIVSAHQQSVADPGRLRTVAIAEDGVIEAVDDPARLFYAGVQWHPERGDEGNLSFGLLQQFVAACRNASSKGQAAPHQ